MTRNSTAAQEEILTKLLIVVYGYIERNLYQSVYLKRDVKNKVTVVYAYKGRNLWLYIEKFCVVQTLYSGYKGRSFL